MNSKTLIRQQESFAHLFFFGINNELIAVNEQAYSTRLFLAGKPLNNQSFSIPEVKDTTQQLEIK